MRPRLYTLCVCVVLLTFAACATPVVEAPGPAEVKPMAEPGNYSARLVATTRRPGVRQPFLFLKPSQPAASLILFTGGDGGLGLSADGIKRPGVFTTRMRTQFADQGFQVAVLDSPSDRSNLNGFRTSQAHAVDVKGVIAFLRKQAPVPVWLVGTSRGTISAASVTALLDEGGPDGLVLTTSLFVTGFDHETVYSPDLARIRVPTLIVHHRKDTCRHTPFSPATSYAAKLVNARPVEVVGFDDAAQDLRGDACGPFHYHGYQGIEQQVVDAISTWIKRHPPQR